MDLSPACIRKLTALEHPQVNNSIEFLNGESSMKIFALLLKQP